MFIGEYAGTIDEKGRISIPAKFRTQLGRTVVITRGLDNSLFLYTLEEWNKLAEKLANLPISSADTRAFARLMLAGAMDCEVDKQGRIIVPPYLKEFAKIAKKLTFAGLYNRIEVWSDELWQSYKAETEKESTTIAEKLTQLGV